MASLLPTLMDPEYKNWVKAGLSLKYTREGILNFVEKNIDQFHQDVLASLPSGANCSSCTTENITPCRHNNNFCRFVQRSCIAHDPSDPSKQYRACPVCDKIRDEIIDKHRFRGLPWRNTDSRLWCRDPWQLAKCFMSEGYSASTSAAETDLPGLLNVVINNKLFDNLVNENMSDRNNIFCKARDVRNKILHKSDMKLTDQVLTEYITTLDTLLSEPKYLASSPDAQKAKVLIRQIQNGSLTVTTVDEGEVRAEALKSIKENTRDSIRAIDSRKRKAMVTLNQTRVAATRDMKSKLKRATKVIMDEKNKAVSSINKEKASVQNTLKTKTDIAVAVIQKETADAANIIKAEKVHAVTDLQTISNESYEKKKKDLQDELISVYKLYEHLSAPLFPLAETNDKKIDELYVQPNMRIVNSERILHDEGTPIESYQDIFKVENKRIYIFGDAGMGKTSLCQNMVSNWCQLHAEPHQIEPMSDDQQALAKFQFLFYISLRNAMNYDNIDEMIKHQLVSQDLQEILPNVIREERCLIILDGLDEWSKENQTTRSGVNKGLPGQHAISNCTVLTTTRPWKLETIKLKATQIDLNIELLGINVTSSEKLIEIMLNHLNKKNENKTMKKDDFISELKKQNLDDFATIPVMLKQLVCLWYSGKPLGKTNCVIYGQMMSLLLELAEKRLQRDPSYQHKKEIWLQSSLKLPSCFDGNDKCMEFKPLLYALGKLAFHTSVCKNKESSLIFKSSQAEIHGLTEEDIKLCLNIGILTKNKITRDYTIAEEMKISFLHKTYQDYFAALYVATETSQSPECLKRIQQICDSLQTWLEMATMFMFISGMCPSIICSLVDHFHSHDNSSFDDIDKYILVKVLLVATILQFMREKWLCSHDKKHLYTETIALYWPSEYTEYGDLLCANTLNLKNIIIMDPPTSRCLHYLYQVKTMEMLTVLQPKPISSSSSLQVDEICQLIQNSHKTVKGIFINDNNLIFRSRSKLYNLLKTVSQLNFLGMEQLTLSKKLLDSLYTLEKHSNDVRIVIKNCKILPETECTE